MNPGDNWGRYQIIRLLGRGAMGEVYLARDTESQVQIALKMVYKGPDPEDLEIIDAERLGAELQQRLSGVDRRVVNVNRYGEDTVEQAGDLFIEMEYIEGEDLSALVSRGPLPYGFSVHIAIELCEMLENLSAFTTTIGDRQFTGVVHGDLKPRNVRINRQNQVKVIDFGIAKALSHTRKHTINVFASTAYCSPERLDTQNMDSHSDLWSVGVLLYQMLSGKLPFDETTKERLEHRIRSAEPPLPLPVTCPEPLARIVFKMLSRDPARRYRSATEMKEDLVRFRRMEPVKAEAAPIAAATDDGEATVRTAKPAPGPWPPPGPPPGPTPRPSSGDGTYRTTPIKEQPIMWPPKGPRSRRNAIGCLVAAAVVGILIVAFIASQWNFWNDADALKNDLQTERVSVSDGWERYEALLKRTHIPFFLWGAQSALKKRLLAAVDATILEYRNNDEPALFEKQWVEAKDNVNQALQLDPGDNAIKGRLRLSEGHIDRINGEPQYHKGVSRPYKLPNRKLLNSAVAKFNEAGDLLKSWPDPYLGLARLYIFDLDDLDKGEAALNRAADLGHPRGKREIAMLADGFLKRADRFWANSQTRGNSPDQERDSLTKADQDYKHAQELYDQVRLFGDVERNRLLAMAGQERVAERLKALQLQVPGSPQ
jgi:serine/threonine protein kinase